MIVVEAGEGVSAAYCGLLLSALGAEVIKVEPLRGDGARGLGPFPDDVPNPERSALFLALNRNKQSIALDLDTPAGQGLFRALVSRAQIVVENEQPGRMDARGIGYGRCAAESPSLVWTAITPFGQDGPYRDAPATELTLFALGGLMLLVGDADREPLMFQGQPGLHGAGLYAFAATLLAVYHAEVCGEGQLVDVSVFESLASSHHQGLVDYDYTGRIRRRGEMRMPIPTLDGVMSFTVQAHRYDAFRRLIMGDQASAENERVDVIERDRNRSEGEMDNEILMWSIQQTKYDAYRKAQSVRVPAAFVAEPADLLDSPQYIHRNYLVTLDHPDAGLLTYPGFPAKMTGLVPEWTAAPRLSEQADDILGRLADLTAAEIADLRAAGVVR